MMLTNPNRWIGLRRPSRRARPLHVCRIPAALGSVLAVFLLFPGPASAQDIRVEAENFTGLHNTGYAPILVKSCPEASGGHAVDGVDVEGEWIRLGLNLTDPTCFRTGLRGAADTTLVRIFEISFFPKTDSSAAVIDTLTTPPGQGIGCEVADYDWAQSTRTECLPAGNYDVIVRRISSPHETMYKTRLDYLELTKEAEPVVSRTWGSLKWSYRAP